MAADCKRPDETAMAGILEQHPCDTEGTILRLAWLQGLSRREINALTWDQVDFGENLLLLPDRSVPMEPSTAECLRRRRAMHHTPAGRVIVSDRSGTPLTAETVSRLARAALDAGGQAVSLMDLRHDWLRRRIAEGGWVYAAEVSGLSVRSLRDRFGAGAAPREASPTEEADTEYVLWRIVQREGSSPAGLAIWMVLAAGSAAGGGGLPDVGAGGLRRGQDLPAGQGAAHGRPAQPTAGGSETTAGQGAGGVCPAGNRRPHGSAPGFRRGGGGSAPGRAGSDDPTAAV